MLDNWQEQLRRGGLELAILLVVAAQRSYGLQIIRELETATALVVTEGTVYPILARLTRDGLLEAEWDASEASHPRKYYALSAKGQRVLAEMTAHWAEFARKIDHLVAKVRRAR